MSPSDLHPLLSDTEELTFEPSPRKVLEIHSTMFEKLLGLDVTAVMELAEQFEELGNRYLDISEHLSGLAASASASAPRG